MIGVALTLVRAGGRLTRMAFGVLAGVSVSWASLGVASARAAHCSQSAQTVTCSFASTGGEQPFAVPFGVSSVSVSATGAAGGGATGSGTTNPGGLGGTASGVLSVTPGSTLYVEVGGTAVAAGNPPSSAFDGGGRGTDSSAGGGGASDVRTVSCAVSCPGSSQSLASRLIVGAGGGGSAFPGTEPVTGSDNVIVTGGAGGAAGSAGTGGVAPNAAGVGGGGGGAPGTAGTGGNGGHGGGAFALDPGATPGGNGGDGGSGQGGAAGASGVFGGAGGGGGGGGYFGGGGGSGGGGGGGGDSWVEPGATTPSIGTASSGAAPSVTISYTVVPLRRAW